MKAKVTLFAMVSVCLSAAAQEPADTIAGKEPAGGGDTGTQGGA